tara:strand:+ start:6147 stop:6311 length:165 start_codon:yes stop_codon:yes gene_type:complete
MSNLKILQHQLLDLNGDTIVDEMTVVEIEAYMNLESTITDESTQNLLLLAKSES